MLLNDKSRPLCVYFSSFHYKMHLNFLGIRSQIAGEENNHDDHKPPPPLIPLMPLIHYCNKIDAVVDYNI